MKERRKAGEGGREEGEEEGREAKAPGCCAGRIGAARARAGTRGPRLPASRGCGRAVKMPSQGGDRASPWNLNLRDKTLAFCKKKKPRGSCKQSDFLKGVRWREPESSWRTEQLPGCPRPWGARELLRSRVAGAVGGAGPAQPEGQPGGRGGPGRRPGSSLRRSAVPRASSPGRAITLARG